jgi:hypothetical protein
MLALKEATRLTPENPFGDSKFLVTKFREADCNSSPRSFARLA